MLASPGLWHRETFCVPVSTQQLQIATGRGGFKLVDVRVKYMTLFSNPLQATIGNFGQNNGLMVCDVKALPYDR